MKKLKIFLLLLAVFLLLPLPCFSQSLPEEETVILTKTEWQQLKMHNATLETNSGKLEAIFQRQEESIKKTEMQLQVANQSLIQLKKETLKTEITIGIVSFSCGLVIGSIAVLLANGKGDL